MDYVELRLDAIENVTTELARDTIESVKSITSKPIILTNRTQEEGGLFQGTEDERVKILKENAPLAEITDIELNTEGKLRQSVIDNANRTIISYHNFERTPAQECLQTIIDEAVQLGGIPKIAVKPNSTEDTYIILRLLMENRGIIAISMDKIGSYTRIIAPLMGSPVTYAAIDNESAPGQLDVKTTSQIIKKLKK